MFAYGTKKTFRKAIYTPMVIFYWGIPLKTGDILPLYGFNE